MNNNFVDCVFKLIYIKTLSKKKEKKHFGKINLYNKDDATSSRSRGNDGLDQASAKHHHLYIKEVSTEKITDSLFSPLSYNL